MARPRRSLPVKSKRNQVKRKDLQWLSRLVTRAASHRRECPPNTRSETLSAKAAAALDQELMSTCAFSIDQLMELAGLSVSQAGKSATLTTLYTHAPALDGMGTCRPPPTYSSGLGTCFSAKVTKQPSTKAIRSSAVSIIGPGTTASCLPEI